MSFRVKKAEIIRAQCYSNGWGLKEEEEAAAAAAASSHCELSAKCGANLSYLVCFSPCASCVTRQQSVIAGMWTVPFSAVHRRAHANSRSSCLIEFRGKSRASVWPCALGSSSAESRLAPAGPGDRAGGERASVIQDLRSHARCMLRLRQFWNPIQCWESPLDHYFLSNEMSRWSLTLLLSCLTPAAALHEKRKWVFTPSCIVSPTHFMCRCKCRNDKRSHKTCLNVMWPATASCAFCCPSPRRSGFLSFLSVHVLFSFILIAPFLLPSVSSPLTQEGFAWHVLSDATRVTILLFSYIFAQLCSLINFPNFYHVSCFLCVLPKLTFFSVARYFDSWAPSPLLPFLFLVVSLK